MWPGKQRQRHGSPWAFKRTATARESDDFPTPSGPSKTINLPGTALLLHDVYKYLADGYRKSFQLGFRTATHRNRGDAIDANPSAADLLCHELPEPT
jgi:hypothetical protein